MATNQDFDNLINRIDDATTTLENSVQTLSEGSADIEAAVTETQQAASAAGQSANTATQAASEAATSLQEVQGIVEDFEEANVIGEAPINGQEYVRKDAEWVLNTGGGDTGGGSVVSVNGVLPDEQGDVSLDIPDAQVNSDWNATSGVQEILNKPELFSGNYEDLSGKPTIPQQGVLSVVAGENITIDNTDPLNPVINSEGGGGEEQGYPLNLPGNMGWYYDGSTITHWPDLNPHNPIELSKLGAYVTGRARQGAELLAYEASRDAFPVGTFYVNAADDPVGSTGGLLRVTWTAEINGVLVGKTFRFTPEPNTTAGDASPEYIAVTNGSSALEWKPIGGESSGGGGESGYPTGASADVFYNSAPFTHWPNPNPHAPAELALVSVNVSGSMVNGADVLNNRTSLQALPEGWYMWVGTDFTNLPTGFPPRGSVFIGTRRSGSSGKFAIVYGLTAGDTAPPMFISTMPTSGTEVIWHEYHQ